MNSFPPEFLWGATAAAHSVEGGNFASDWWAWEQRPGRIDNDATSEIAAGHAARYSQDFQLARKLGHNAHCFSLEWSRLQPQPDRFDPAALDHYHRVFDALHAAQLTPVCVLNHVTLPKWFADMGGWHRRGADEAFHKYADHVARAYASRCQWWIPVAEPMRPIDRGYLDAQWPPAHRSWRLACRAMRNLARAHAHAYGLFHGLGDGHRIGFSVRARLCDPLDVDSAWDLRAARREAYRCNRMLPDAVLSGQWPPAVSLTKTPASNFDFLAVAPAPRRHVRFDWRAYSRQFARVQPDPRDDATDPEGVRAILRAMAGYHRPLLILGNGIATEDDALRRRFLLNHLRVVLEELEAGLDVVGYFHRALLDGFEWEQGYRARYGMVHVDRATLTRTPNLSAYMYKDIIEHRAIRPGTVARYCPD